MSWDDEARAGPYVPDGYDDTWVRRQESEIEAARKRRKGEAAMPALVTVEAVERLRKVVLSIEGDDDQFVSEGVLRDRADRLMDAAAHLLDEVYGEGVWRKDDPEHDHACCPPDDCCGGPCAAHPHWHLTT